MQTYDELLKNHSHLDMFNLPALLGVNLSKDYQERLLLIATVLTNFLSQNNLLINIQPYYINGDLKKDLVIKLSNLTPDGVELFRKPVNNWFKAHDRGTPIEKITILERGLAKIRANQNPTSQQNTN